MFVALIWDIVHSCKSGMIRYVIENLTIFDIIEMQKMQILHFLKNQLFSILIISLVIFDLQKHTIPQIKAWNILFWPYFIHFTARMGIWWAMKPRKCAVFCSTDFTCKVLGYYNKNICSVKILLCKAWPTLLNYT